MKKVLAAIFALVMVLSVLPAGIITASAGLFPPTTDPGNPGDPDGRYYSGGFTYTVYSGKATICGWSGPSGADLVIPSSLDGKTVVSLAFDTGGIWDVYPFMSHTPRTVTLPATITNLGYKALSHNGTLESIYFLGNAPSVYDSSYLCEYPAKVYYLAGRTGFTTPTWMGKSCEPIQGVNVTFDANGGTGGSGPVLMFPGLALSAPTVKRTGYTFTSWSPAVPSTALNADTTYVAQWRENSPGITFNSNGGSAVNAIFPGYNNSISKPTDPVKAGFNFGGWFSNAELTIPVIWPFTVKKSAIFYAKWNAENCYTVIFDANGGTGGTNAALPAGDPLEAPVVARTGCVFAGWLPIVPAAVPTENTVYTAQWTANTYTVNCNGNGNDGGSTASSLHTYDIASTLTANGFTKVGHSVLGWSTDSGATAPAYTDGQSVLNLTPNQGEVITFYAVWAINYYTITFDASGGSGGTTASKQYNTALMAPMVTRTGYMFASWSPEVPTTVPAGNTTYTAQWTAHQYLVTFDPQGGLVSPSDSTVTYGSTYGAGTGGFPTPTRTGYTFGGWYTSSGGNGTRKYSTTTVSTAAAHTLYAKWTGISYTVAYNGNGSTGGSTANNTHTYDTAKTLTANGYTKTGFAFEGWATSADGPVVYSDKQSVLNLTQTSGATVTLYAKWTDVNVSTVTFDANGGTGGKSTTLIIGSTLTAPITTRTGYTFSSWSPVVPSTVPAVNTTYIAQWTANTFIVTFNPRGGTVSPTSSTVTYDSAYGAGTGGFPTPVRAGYKFDGWFTSTSGAGTQIFSTTIAARTSSQTLYAFWSADSVNITFDANGGTGGTSASMTTGTTLTAPVVTKPGYVFAGWSPAVPSTVPAANTTYTAQWTKTAVSITKLSEGFKVNIQGWAVGNKYQIWSYQSITSNLFNSETASQWILSKPYTSGSAGTAEGDGSISFTIADFVSPDSNYTIAVRITDADGNYLGEIRDSYTPTDVSEVKIAKVLVDGEYSTGKEIREIKAGAAMTFTVAGNNVPGTVFTAKVLENGTPLTANSTTEFGWDISALTPGIYTVQFTAANGETTDTRNISVQLYSLDTGIQYGNISSLGLTATQDNTLPKALTIDPDFTNGSFYYRVAEPGRKAIFTSGLFQPADSIEYTFTKYGVYQVSGFVNRTYEVKIGRYYDDGYIKQFTVSRSQTEPSSVELEASADITKPVDKATPLLFTASADIGGIGATPVEYSFWRYDAKGFVLVKDWSSDNTLDWTPARVGIYTIQVRAKGIDAGSFEAAQSVQVTVTDNTDQIAQGVVITLNEAELSANAQARAPITVKANATSSNSDDLLYKFYVTDAAMGTGTLQNYSADSNCIWTPRKAGTYTISVLVKNNASYGAYDAMESFDNIRVSGGDQG